MDDRDNRLSVLEFRHIGLVAASSDRALKVLRGGFSSFHQNGINPVAQKPVQVRPLRGRSSAPWLSGRR
jgi:hypothetical protein